MELDPITVCILLEKVSFWCVSCCVLEKVDAGDMGICTVTVVLLTENLPEKFFGKIYLNEILVQM